METIWLQRPSGDIPWGFRLQGGREFNEPLSVQRVTPGSVAANGLVPGDVILKIGHVNATGITHNEAQEVICGASNILQLTIKKGAGANTNILPASSIPQYSSLPSTNQYSSAPNQYPYDYDEQQDRYQTLPNYPDYRIGSGYQGYSNTSSPSGYNSSDGYTQVKDANTNSSPYDMRQFEQTPPISGYSTMPARSGNRHNSEYVRPVNESQNQNKYPFKATAGIKLNINPHPTSVSRDDMQQPNNEEHYSQSQPMSPVQYMNGNKANSSFQRQPAAGSNKSDPNSSYTQSYFKNPTPFSPGCNIEESNSAPPPRLQRQTSSSNQSGTGNVYESTISQGFKPGTFLPRSEEGPPPPPPPANYQPQSEQYRRQPYDQDVSASTFQRQSSQQGNYAPNMYEQRKNDYNSYQQKQNPGMFVDMTVPPGLSYQRQGSKPCDYSNSSSQYQQQPSIPTYYEDRQVPSQSPAELQRQISTGRQQPSQTYNGPISPPQYSRQTSRDQQQMQHQPLNSQPPRDQQYVRQQSREQRPEPPTYTVPSSPPDGKLNSFEDILSPFEKFQTSNYCDKLFARDSGVSSDYLSQSQSSDTPRSNLSSYSPPQTYYSSGYNNGDVQRQPQTLLRAAPPAPPPPPISPHPPPPPPPPSNWTPTPQKTKLPMQSRDQSAGQQMPDKVLDTMLKHGGSQKPFAYLPTGADLKEFKEKAKQRRQPRSVMPRGYVGPAVDDETPPELQRPQMSKSKPTGSVPSPETGVYKHAQYNSPLRMYSTDNAKEAFDVQSGGNVDVTGINSTPDRRPSDIKESEVYKMIQERDAKGKENYVNEFEEAETVRADDKERVSQETISIERISLENDRDRLLQENLFSSAPTTKVKGLSFRILQWLTDTADVDDEVYDAESPKPKKQPRDPLLRHNSADDEMRFSGLHTKAEIPSKAFKMLNKIAGSDNMNVTVNQEAECTPDEVEDNQIGNYDEASIRYKGNHIPSPSFRLLQTLAREGEMRQKSGSPSGRMMTDSEDDGLPDKLNEEDMPDKRYTGSSIPSRSFQALKTFMDSDRNESSTVGDTSGPKIKVLSKASSPKVAPRPTSNRSSPLPHNVHQEAPSSEF